jgi:exodeoxyribonuclease VII large subunit
MPSATRLQLWDAGKEERSLTVSELTAQIKDALEGDFSSICLRGEISGLARPRSGHIYFNLKDDSATIRAVMWRSVASRLVFDLDNGLAVKVRGGVTVYESRGEYQVMIRTLEPEGVGALELAFRQVMERLAAEGLFDAGRKRPLPRFPRRIVVVTSPTGAAVRDFLQVVGRRWAAVEILIAAAKVQGAGAAEEIVAAIALANRVEGADLVVLARGGGSLEDLWAFNEEIVARAIFGSRLPVISAIGHEVDVTIADFVADFRALTPSEAGERCVPDAREMGTRLDHLTDRLGRLIRGECQHARARRDRAGERLLRLGSERLRDARRELDALGDRADSAIRAALDRRAHAIARCAAQLEALSPLGVLARGYSLTLADDGRTVVRAAADCTVGSRIRTRLAAGSLISRVEEIEG